MPNRPIVAELPNGETRILWADPDAELALRALGSAGETTFEAYVVKVESEEQIEKLRRGIALAKLNATGEQFGTGKTEAPGQS
jgi:hypothetical protein